MKTLRSCIALNALLLMMLLLYSCTPEDTQPDGFHLKVVNNTQWTLEISRSIHTQQRPYSDIGAVNGYSSKVLPPPFMRKTGYFLEAHNEDNELKASRYFFVTDPELSIYIWSIYP